MVFNEALCAANLASAVLANGVCCFYQMRREEVQKQQQEVTIRQTIFSEWERQRYLDMVERQEAQRQLGARLEDERRRRLMVTKQVCNSSQRLSDNVSIRQSDIRDPPQSISPTTILSEGGQSGDGSCKLTSASPPRCSLKFQGQKKNIFSGEKSSFRVYESSVVSKDYLERELSSLIDDCEDELEEVCIE